MKSLNTLKRLAKQAVDHERQALLAIDAEMADVERAIDTRRRAIAEEASDPLDFRTAGATLQAYIAAAKTKIRELEGRSIQLQEAHHTQLARVRAARVKEKRYERLAERRAREAEREAAAKEQKTIDELVGMSAGRRAVRIRGRG